MSFPCLALKRGILALSVLVLVSACVEDGRKAPLSDVEVIEIPVADIDNQMNQNIDNPTLVVPGTFEVSPGDALTLVWSDEFDGTALDPETWFFATGDGSEEGLPPGWGNNELQYYLPDNAQVSGGILTLTAKREIAEGFNYTSARINTADRFAFQYGRIEASIKLPSGQGLWPAFWMLSQDSPYGSWAATGEIDIMEAVNLDGTGGNEIFGTLHYGGEFPANTFTSVEYTPSVDVTADFHTYALEWDSDEIRWYFDDTLYAVQNSWFSTAAPYPAPFDQPFHILLNLAVGGNLPGAPNNDTPLPATMEVDWVRVYSGEEDLGPPADPGTIPDVVIYSSDPNETIDLVFGVDYAGFDGFGSGSAFDNNVTTDRDFSPAFGVTTGDGYGAQVGQFAIVGFAAGFATGYETLDFKAKGLNNDIIRVKFLDDPNYIDVTLTSSPYSTALGNDWYQVSIPLADFTGVATATGLLFETDNTAASSFTFLLTDFGFSGTAGAGGTPITPEAIVYATDPGLTEDLAPPAVDNFGSAAVFDFNFAGDTDYSPAIQATSGEGYGAGVHVGFIAFNGYTAGFAAGYGTMEFKVKVNDIDPSSDFEVKFINGGDTSALYDLTNYSGSEALGNGWYQVQIPMSDFAATIDANSGFLLGPVGGQANSYTMLLTDIGFSGTAGGGGSSNCDPVNGEIATNGDFETGDLSCFEVFDNGGTIAADNTENNGGMWSAHVVAGTGNNPVLKLERRAAGIISGNAPVTVSFDMKGSAADGGVIFPELISEGAGGATASEILETIVAPTADWSTYTYNTTAAADVAEGLTFQLAIVCGGAATCSADVFIDNISVQFQ